MEEQEYWESEPMEMAERWEYNLSLFLDCLDDSNPKVRANAITNLWEYAEREIMERFLEMAVSDPSPAVRCKAISGLGRYVYEGEIMDFEVPDPYIDDWMTQEDYKRVYDFLVAIGADSQRSFDEKRFAVEALSFVHNDTVYDLIAGLYAMPEKQAKISALFAMGRNGAERWLDILGNEIWSRDIEIQVEAIDAAGEMNAEPLSKDLCRLTYSHDKKVVMSAIWALGQTGTSCVFERLDELTLDADPDVSELADAALEEWMLFNHFAAESEEEEEDWGLMGDDDLLF